MPVGMYKLKPFYDSQEKVELPNVMYKVNPFYGTGTTGKVSGGNLDPVSALEQRQESILNKLAELRHTLDKLTGQYQVPAASPESPVGSKASGTTQQKPSAAPQMKQCSGVTVPSPLGNGIHDIVISADPESPPLSLFMLYEVIKQQFKVLATSYVHSSVTSVDPRLCEAIKNGSQVSRGDHQVALSVIWKKVDNGPQLMISPAKQSHVTGEVNIARYVNRILSPGFDTEDIVMATYIDEWLDTADFQIFNGNSKQKTAAVKSLNTRLKRNDWMVGSSMSLVDMVMWSALHQSQLANSAPENVQKWLQRCNDLAPFKTALAIL